MQNLLAQIKGCFIVTGLPDQLQSSRQQFALHYDTESLKRLTQLAGVFLVLAVLLWAVAGYHGAFHLLNQFTPLLPDTFWQIATFMGDTTVVLSISLLVARRNPAILWVLLIAAVYGTLVTHGLKNLVGAERPPVSLVTGEYNLVGKALKNGSFPSGHSLTAFVFVSIAFYFFRNFYLRIALLLTGALIAFSRVMVAAHWPVDVFVGSGFGLLVTVAAVVTAQHIHWGFKVPLHLFIVFLLVVASLMILTGHDGGYPQAHLFGKLIAFSALLMFIVDYFFPYKSSSKQTLQ
ncbi:phosphatase PAP2 family protein [Amphritea balenae]|uniref:undecaprenyl-diphosphate phosphatase n=1 Tax=Amphritea balenae TaxID=452629 RepID=A0A3P1SQW7_9GAMM|nr:phosphatase PAP2 family protein [Amphritea balenae]RRC98562.1 phosphatase PAP2 family protein [Amphritea balenae]GGK65538.1 hypothetical protein GCM10007941_14650 [Amphritea balenae]